jgi:DNA-directed RNA polymerase specialized sigma24 family protein
MILLRDFEELTIAEICERLDVSVATAKARLRRARVLVREYLLGADQSSPAGTVSSGNLA